MLDGTAIKELSDRFARPLGELGPLVAVPAGYALKDPTAVIEPGPKAAALQVNTLDAVCDYLKANRDKVDLARVVVHVVSPNCVKVLGPLDARSRVRETFVEATCADLTKDFIGQFRGHEEFMIGLQTRFTDLGQRPDVLRLLGSV